MVRAFLEDLPALVAITLFCGTFERYEAQAAWYLHNAVDRVTPEASALYDRTLSELLETGEISETTSFLWDDLKARAENSSRKEAA